MVEVDASDVRVGAEISRRVGEKKNFTQLHFFHVNYPLQNKITWEIENC